MRRWLACGLVVATAAAAAASAPLARQSARLSVRDAIALYSRGDFGTAVRDLDTQRLRVAPFTRALDEWIAEGDSAVRQQRRLVAAAFALDLNWAVTRTFRNRPQSNADPSTRTPPIDPEREPLSEYESQPLVAHWAVQQLPATGAPDSLERMLRLSAIALTEDGHAWHRLERDILPSARKRLPDEPRVRLAGVLARTNLDLGALRNRPGTLGARDVLRNETAGSAATRPIPAAIRAFEPLLSDASLAGEVELRIGYLELRRKNWPAALMHFEAARSKSSEPTIRAAADYFAGWVFEQLDRPDDAIAPYRRALAITPTMRNLATRLAALLYLRNERTEAYSVLDLALNARPAPLDLMVVMERADARFVPEWLASIREALK
jgi:tetratricopeptide (TPR) repeat protein